MPLRVGDIARVNYWGSGIAKEGSVVRVTRLAQRSAHDHTQGYITAELLIGEPTDPLSPGETLKFLIHELEVIKEPHNE